MNNTKIHIYFVPGLAASPQIFEYLDFPEETFELHFLEWLLPLSDNESIEHYAARMSKFITHQNAVLIGVSFGGIMAQEMSKIINFKKVILISSIKSRDELPNRLKVLQKTKFYKLFPLKVLTNLDVFSKIAFGSFIKKRVKLYKKYLSVNDKKYIMWAIYNVLNWQNTTPNPNILHIHGTKDYVFPIKHIKNAIKIKKGTHIMVLNKAKTISKIIIDSL